MNNDIVKGIVDYIEKHLEEDLSLDKIAEDLNYSKFYISRIFSEKTGGTIYKYIQGRRLTIAAYKLVKTDKSIIEIGSVFNFVSMTPNLIPEAGCGQSPRSLVNTGSFSNLP